MWIMTTVGFFSVVQASADELMVRARSHADIERMRRALLKHVYASELRIITTMHADYPFRLIVRRDLFADYMREMVAGIDYGNFKSEVAKTDPQRSHYTYGRVWSVLRGDLDPRERSADPFAHAEELDRHVEANKQAAKKRAR